MFIYDFYRFFIQAQFIIDYKWVSFFCAVSSIQMCIISVLYIACSSIPRLLNLTFLLPHGAHFHNINYLQQYLYYKSITQKLTKA